MEQTKLVSRVWGPDESGKDPWLDGDTRRITLRRGAQQMVIYEGDDGALDWDDNSLGRGDKRRETLNEMWDSYAGRCDDGSGESRSNYDDSLQVKITAR